MVIAGLVVAALALVAATAFGWTGLWPNDADDTGPGSGSSAPAATETPTPDPPREIRFTIAAGGDILIHSPVYQAARTGDGYDFVPLMEPAAEYTRGADLALCNLEVPLIRPGQQPSSYPMFGAPPVLAQNLADLGWDGCSTANNHSLDRGFDALQNTLDLFDEAGLGHAGTARTEAEAARPQIYWSARARRSRSLRSRRPTAPTGSRSPPKRPGPYNCSTPRR